MAKTLGACPNKPCFDAKPTVLASFRLEYFESFVYLCLGVDPLRGDFFAIGRSIGAAGAGTVALCELEVDELGVHKLDVQPPKTIELKPPGDGPRTGLDISAYSPSART